MCGGKAPPPPPAAVPETPRLPDVGGQVGGSGADKRRRASAAGESGRSTILTGSRGVQNGGATVTKTLLGS